jgi:hypothetical protein
MSKLGKIVKGAFKAKKESVMGKLGDAPFEDPMEPWSAKYNAPVKEEVEDLTEDSVLYRYIRSKGYSPEHMDFAHRSAFARSRAFKTYKIMHQKRKEREAQGGIHDIKAVAKEEVGAAALFKASAENSKAKMDAMKASAATKDYEKKQVMKSVTKEEVEDLTEAGVGGLMNFIRSKGLDPTSMDGNHKKHYSRSSEYRVFKTMQPEAEEAKALYKEREKAKEDKKKPKKVNETSGMGERGDDWNEETTPAKAKKPYTHEVIHIKSGRVMGKYTSSSTAHRGADKHDNNYGGYAHAVRPIKEAVDEKDTVTMDIPLLIRVLEYAREDAKTDMDLHKVVENLINMRGDGALSMEMYNKIVAIKEAIEEADSLEEGVVDSAKKVWKAISDFDSSSPKYDGNTRRRQELRKKLVSQKQKKMTEADEAKYGEKYQAAVKRVGQKAAQKPVDMKSLAARMQASYAKDKKPLKELKKQDDNQELDAHITREEVEELSELSKGTLKSYIKDRGETIHADKRDSNKARNNAADAQAQGKQKSADAWHDEADWLHKRARKGATNVTKAAIKVAKKTNEEVEQIEEASSRKQQSMKSARMIKSLYKKKLKESTYDWEKDDKGSKKTTAKITVKGGTTMTGKPRDTVEIEPVLKTRPNRAGGMKPEAE